MNGLQEKPTLGDVPIVNQSIGIEKRGNDIPYGYCHCGCGQKTLLARWTNTKRGHIKGEPLYFLSYHHNNGKIGELNPRWKGGITKNEGRVLVRDYENPKSPWKIRSRYICEKILGKPLLSSNIVHHVDENPLNDSNNNLVLCENRGYHKLLHQRTNAYKICGHVNWRKCQYCKKYDNLDNLTQNGTHTYHKNCCNKYAAKRREYKKIISDLQGE